MAVALLLALLAPASPPDAEEVRAGLRDVLSQPGFQRELPLPRPTPASADSLIPGGDFRRLTAA